MLCFKRKVEDDDELTKNELAKLHTFMQIIEVGQHNLSSNADIQKTEAHIHKYIQSALNDHSSSSDDHPNIQIPFYNANLTIEKNDFNDSRIYTINFNILSVQFWRNEVKKKLEDVYFGELQTKVTSARLVSDRVVESLKSFKRDPTSIDALHQDAKRGCLNIPGDNCFQKVLNYWLIVPRVQWDFFDLLYQMYTFDIFHQGFLPKCVHFFTIPTNVVITMMFFAQFNFPNIGEVRYGSAFAFNWTFVILLVLGVLYIIMGILRKSWAWGVATFIVLTCLTLAGNMWFYSYRTEGNPWYNPTSYGTNPFIWSYVISFIQAISHIAVPQMPPYITGVEHWESVRAYMYICKTPKNAKSRAKHICFVVLSVVLFLILSVSVAWFSWPHLIGTEVIYIMAGIGYRPRYFKKFFRVVEKIELQGNPIIDTFPTTHKDIKIKLPEHVRIMVEEGLVSKNATDGDVFECIATLKLASIYLRRGTQETISKRKVKERNAVSELPVTTEVRNKWNNLEILLAARKGFIGKSNK
ncbi:uncharacterized protein [Mytilus edulis]|uniref:uncharacterized protein n=1 Tax=Mytilus edulis TaxID=6550 RepID=UPI0039EFA39F